VVGLGSGWHTALVMGQITPKLHAVRLAQCAEVELELAASGRGVKGETGLTHMQLDGEPWAQQIPAAGQGQQPLRVSMGEAQARLETVVCARGLRINIFGQ
jgi:diacylglycerol kinase (ATP)